MSSKIINRFKIAFLSIALITAGAANIASADVVEEEKPPVENWQKSCFTDENSIRFCQMKSIIIVTNNQTGAQFRLSEVAIEQRSNSKREEMFVHISNGISLQSGLRIQIDKGKIRIAPYTVCNNTTCSVQLNLTKDFIDRLKAGKMLNLHYLQYNGEPVSFGVPLDGFEKAYNSKGIEVLPTQQKAEGGSSELLPK